MKANKVVLNDLNVVTTTVVMREIPYNPDIQKVFLYDLSAVNTTVIMHYFGEVSSGSTAWTKSLADTVTLSDALAKSASKLLTDTTLLSDALFKSTGLVHGDSITLSEAIVKAIGLSESDNVTLSEALANAYGLNQSDAVTLSDYITLTPGGGSVAWTLGLSDTITLSDLLAYNLIGSSFISGRSSFKEDKMSKLVREYIRDTVASVSDSLSFSYARESDFDAIRRKKFPAVLLKPLRYTVSRNDEGRVLDYQCTLLFYELDAKGDDEKKTQTILDNLDPYVQAFQAKLNIKSLTVTDDPSLSVTSEKIIIYDESVNERIKFTSDIVTGWEFNFKLSVPDPLNYCSIY